MSDDAGDGDGAYDEVPDAAPLATPPAEPEPEGTGTISGGAAVIMSALSDLHDGRGSLPDAEYEAMRAEMEEGLGAPLDEVFSQMEEVGWGDGYEVY